MKVILIGFMGSGKTTVGKSIAKKLNKGFIDIDKYIEEKYSTTINEIFKNQGEKAFREIESDILKELLHKENIVISTGGGVITTKENVEMLKKEKNVIFLDANVNTIIEHISKDENKRPLLNNSDDLERDINKLLKERYSKYKDTSSIDICIDSKNIDEVISEILVYIG